MDTSCPPLAPCGCGGWRGQGEGCRQAAGGAHCGSERGAQRGTSPTSTPVPKQCAAQSTFPGAGCQDHAVDAQGPASHLRKQGHMGHRRSLPHVRPRERAAHGCLRLHQPSHLPPHPAVLAWLRQLLGPHTNLHEQPPNPPPAPAPLAPTALLRSVDGNNAGSNQDQYGITKLAADARKGERIVKVGQGQGRAGQHASATATAAAAALEALPPARPAALFLIAGLPPRDPARWPPCPPTFHLPSCCARRLPAQTRSRWDSGCASMHWRPPPPAAGWPRPRAAAVVRLRTPAAARRRHRRCHAPVRCPSLMAAPAATAAAAATAPAAATWPSALHWPAAARCRCRRH